MKLSWWPDVTVGPWVWHLSHRSSDLHLICIFACRLLAYSFYNFWVSASLVVCGKLADCAEVAGPGLHHQSNQSTSSCRASELAVMEAGMRTTKLRCQGAPLLALLASFCPWFNLFQLPQSDIRRRINTAHDITLWRSSRLASSWLVGKAVCC